MGLPEAAAAEAEAGTDAGSVHDRGRGYHSSPVTGSRPPTEAERAAASQLATEVADDRVEAAHQRHLGIPVTARPFRTRQRRQVECGQVEQPPLAIGIAADVSGSTRWAEAPGTRAAWIIASAARLPLTLAGRRCRRYQPVPRGGRPRCGMNSRAGLAWCGGRRPRYWTPAADAWQGSVPPGPATGDAADPARARPPSAATCPGCARPRPPWRQLPPWRRPQPRRLG
jgi:hypothetical protein